MGSKQNNELFSGEVVTLKDSSLYGADQEKQDSSVNLEAGNDLWCYQTMHTFMGTPVAQEAQDLPIDSEELLRRALSLHRTPKSVVLRITPDSPEGNDKYAELLRKQAEGEIVITGEERNFDAAKSGYIVWVTYDELLYVLNPRYAFLKNE